MSIINIQLISTMVAEQLSHMVLGIPTENRILIAVPSTGGITSTGLIIPSSAKEELPRKGVVIKSGTIGEEYNSYKEFIKPGTVVTHGLYAGKKIELNELPKEIVDNNDFMVIHVNECIYIEPNND